MNSSGKPCSEVRRIVAAFGYSVAGLRWVISHPAFRTELIAACVMLPFAFVFGHTGVERAMLVSSLLLVLIVELLNTGIEAAIDRIGPEIHPLSKAAKDVGSSAVLLSLILAGAVWLLIMLG
jgi:diacylglycerol kinase (ATP)